MRHRLFWDILSKKTHDADDTRYVEAGLRVMRHLDVYLESGPEKARLATNVRSLSRHLDVCGNTPMGVLLREAVDMVERPKCSFDSVTGLLCAYGRMLELGEDWPLAHDVWEVVIDAIETIGIPAGLQSGDTLTYAWACFARVTRRMGHYELCRERFGRAIALAKEYALPKILMTATIGDGVALGYMGKWNEALETLGIQIERAAIAGWPDLQARAVINRGQVYYHMGRHADALADFEAGILVDPNTLDTEVGLSNIAACAAEGGYFELAKETHQWIFENARSHTARMGSAVNLVELAIWMNDREDFERTVAQAASLTLDSAMDVYRELYTIRGQVHFRLIADGVPRLQRLLESAQSHYLAAAIAEIRRDLARINAGGPFVPPGPTPVPKQRQLPNLERSLRQFQRVQTSSR